jgi:hypothetical protein
VSTTNGPAAQLKNAQGSGRRGRPDSCRFFRKEALPERVVARRARRKSWRPGSSRRTIGGFPAAGEFPDEITGSRLKHPRHHSMHERHETGLETIRSVSERYALML